MVKVVQGLADLVVQLGSVNAVADQLSAAPGSGGRIYPNRIHGLLTGDASRSVNSSTLSTLEHALATASTLLDSGKPALDRTRLASAYIALVDRRGADAAGDVAEAFGIPVGVVRAIVGDASASGTASSGPSRSPATTPDWSWQDQAIKDSLASLNKVPVQKVGLIVPTGGGKTRIALQIALRWLASNSGAVLWVTHRAHLRAQARRTLQALVKEARLSGEEAVNTFDRIQFTMTHGLQDKVTELGDGLSLVIVDEAHHAAAASYAPVVDQVVVPGLFLTATPNRTDGLPIGIDEIAYMTTYRELFERGCVIPPTFDPIEDMPNLDWSSTHGLRDLADFLLERAETDFSKPLVAVSLKARAELLYEAILEQLDGRPSHPLTPEDIGYVHGSRNSRSMSSSSEFLDEFSARPAGILIATGQLLGEGFDDPSIDAAVVTYPSESMGHLMQVAGRALRWAPGKQTAHIIQVRSSKLEYHFDQRWLYQDISDALRPALRDVHVASLSELVDQVERIIVEHRLPNSVAERIRTELSNVEIDRPLSLMLAGTPYFGDVASFSNESMWDAVLVTPSNRDRFVRLFNDASDRRSDIKNSPAFLAKFLRDERSVGGVWASFGTLLQSMEYARREIAREQYYGDDCRGYNSGKATTWLKYYTFSYRPAVPVELAAFLADTYNRDELLGAYASEPDRWRLAVRLELPVSGAEGFLLDEEQGGWLVGQQAAITERLALVDRGDVLSTFGQWRTALPSTPVPLRLLDQFAQLLRAEREAAHLLKLPVEAGEVTSAS
ncbi:MAG: DEAD/DEAH box helicase [Gaiellales bacterium]